MLSGCDNLIAAVEVVDRKRNAADFVVVRPELGRPQRFSARFLIGGSTRIFSKTPSGGVRRSSPTTGRVEHRSTIMGVGVAIMFSRCNRLCAHRFNAVPGEQKVVGITSFGDRDCKIIGVDQRTDAFAAKAFIRKTAPDLFCIGDGYCQPACRLASLPNDPDCSACTTDSECSTIANGVLCEPSSGQCYAGTEAIGGLGQLCGEGGRAEYISGLCVERDGVKTCSQSCSADTDNCPADFNCVAIDDANNGVCLVDEGGCGCASTNSSSGLGAGLLMLLSLGLIRRRKEQASWRQSLRRRGGGADA